jgi:hypothetical protein
MTVTPAAATLIGVALGSALGGLVALPWHGRESLILWLAVALPVSVGGYILWLTSDPVRGERFQRMASRVALVAVAALLLAFPDFWWQMWRADRSLSVCLVGGVCATSMFVVGTGWGLMHLVCYLKASLRSETKASLTPSSGGVWDRELDELPPAIERNT